MCKFAYACSITGMAVDLPTDSPFRKRSEVKNHTFLIEAYSLDEATGIAYLAMRQFEKKFPKYIWRLCINDKCYGSVGEMNFIKEKGASPPEGEK